MIFQLLILDEINIKPVEITNVTRSKSFIVKYLFKYFSNLVSQYEEGGSCESNNFDDMEGLQEKYQIIFYQSEMRSIIDKVGL